MEYRPGPWLPIFQSYPTFLVGSHVWTNYNARNGPRINNTFVLAHATKLPILEVLVNINPDDNTTVTFESTLMHPIFRKVPELDQ